MDILRTENVTMKFGGVTAVSDFNLKLEQGKITALIGPNGAGKTTAFNVLTGVYTPTTGKVILKDTDITGIRPDKITTLGIARTFQNIRLFNDLSVLDNVLVGNHLHLKSGIISAALRLPKYNKEDNEIKNKSLELLNKVGLYDFKDEKASSLPYGMQRRLEIARALATDPSLLLLDEPAAGMNPKESYDLTSFILSIRDEYKLTIFMIEHHMQVVMDISDKIYVFDYGITIAEGNPNQIQNNKKVIEAYLGVEEDA
ncbi:MAG: ABC transporter ATP-binding protein [Bacillota bacterium]|nr:ABC transporter ATP-binding protein [Bacillota bacterium]